MSVDDRQQLDVFMTQLEENWANLETLFNEIERLGAWGRPHGPDWIFADLPYHLAYCNADILIRGLKSGKDLPAEQQELLLSVDDINAWNARKLNERPVGQTPQQSIEGWRETCAEIRRLAAEMTDEDLESPFFMPLFRGWNTAREGFEFTRAHDLIEFVQLRLHLGRRDPVPSAPLKRAFLQRVLGSYPMFLNQAAAEGRVFTAVMAFADPDVGAFTLQVKGNSATFMAGNSPGADLVMTQSAETFVKTLTGMHDPAAAMQSGEIRVNDFNALAVFGELFTLG